MVEPKLPPTPQTMIDAMKWVEMFVTDLMNDWPDWPFENGGIQFKETQRLRNWRIMNWTKRGGA
jgi:hypothetical protein